MSMVNIGWGLPHFLHDQLSRGEHLLPKIQKFRPWILHKVQQFNLGHHQVGLSSDNPILQRTIKNPFIDDQSIISIWNYGILFSHDKVSLPEGLVSLVPKLGFSELTFDPSHWTPGRSRYSLPSSRLPPPSKWCQWSNINAADFPQPKKGRILRCASSGDASQSNCRLSLSLAQPDSQPATSTLGSKLKVQN